MRTAVPLALVVVAGIVYHVAQKASGSANPWAMLGVAYATALGLTIAIAIAQGGPATWPAGRAAWLGGLAIGVAAFGIEAGFFFLYRAGSPLASVSVIANVSVTAVLAVAGIIGFHEHLTTGRAVGIVLAAAGAALIGRG